MHNKIECTQSAVHHKCALPMRSCSVNAHYFHTLLAKEHRAPSTASDGGGDDMTFDDYLMNGTLVLAWRSVPIADRAAITRDKYTSVTRPNRKSNTEVIRFDNLKAFLSLEQSKSTRS